MSILRDRSQLEFYISALERWATIAKASGIAETILADIVLTHAFKQAPELCKEMSDHFDNSVKNNNMEFNPKADNVDQNFENCKASMRKSQYNKTANHQVIGNQYEQSATSIFIASLDNNDDSDQEQVESIKTFLGNIYARGGCGGGRRGGARGGHAGGDLIEANKMR